jgi:murein DD-endopeptidase MepM/ murein hydrolase activator NlpD
MPRLFVPCGLRVWLRVAGVTGVALGVANCSDSARFTSGSYGPPDPPVSVQVSEQSSQRSTYNRVVSQPLPLESRSATVVANNTSGKSVTGLAKKTDYRSVASTKVARPTSVRNETHVVKPGESLAVIARRYDLSVSALARANKLKPNAKINIGDRISIPMEHIKIASREPVVDRSQRRNTIAGISSSNSSDVVDSAPPVENVQVAIQEPKSTENVMKKAEPVEAVPSFRWPVHGRVISGFGPRLNGIQNDGINVAVPEGTPIRAAEEGVVAYAGNELKGYGNLVLIRHPNGYVSAYANASELLVKRGDKISRGQVVAHAGQTGNVTSPQLHFEIRKGSTPVDPTKYLGGA